MLRNRGALFESHGVFAQRLGGGGGNGGDGGDVDIVSTGNIVTRGQASNGIFAQSVGGGGDQTGDNGTGFAFSGSAGGDGAG